MAPCAWVAMPPLIRSTMVSSPGTRYLLIVLSLSGAVLDAQIATRDETIESASRGWEMREAELRLDGPDGEVVLSKAQDRVPLTRAA